MPTPPNPSPLFLFSVCWHVLGHGSVLLLCLASLVGFSCLILGGDYGGCVAFWGGGCGGGCCLAVGFVVWGRLVCVSTVLCLCLARFVADVSGWWLLCLSL